MLLRARIGLFFGVSFALLTLSARTQAASRYWVSSSTGNWTNINNWSATSGGAGGASLPTATDDVVFNGSRIGACTINTNISVSSFTVSTSALGGYSATIVQLSTVSVTIYQNFVITRGTYSVSGASVTVSSNVAINGGVLNLGSASNMLVRGNWTNAAAGLFVAGTSTVTFSTSTLNHSITNVGKPFNNVQFNGVGSWVLVDSMTVRSTMTLTSGSLDTSASNLAIGVAGSWSNTGGQFLARASTVTFTAGNVQSIRSGGSPFYNIHFNNSAGSWVLVDSMTVLSTMTITGGTLDTSSNSQPMSVTGSWANNGGNFVTRTSTINFTGAGVGNTLRTRGSPMYNLQLSGVGYWTLLDSVTVTSTMTLTAGTLDTSASNLAVSVGGSWWNTGGLFVTRASTITLTAGSSQSIRSAGNPFNIIQFNNAAGTWVLIDSMTVTSSMTFTAGTLDTSTNNLPVAVGGSWTNNSGNFTTRNSTVSFTGAFTTTNIRSRGFPFYNLEIGGSGYWTLIDSVTVASTMTITGGTLDTSTGNLGVSVGGSWINTSGNFKANNSVIAFNATSPGQEIQSRGSPFRNLTLGLAGSGGYWTLVDSITVSTVTVRSGATIDINGFSVWTTSITNRGELRLQGIEPVRAVPLNVAGSTITYTATSGSPPVLSTWSYRSLSISGGAGVVFGATGNLTVAENLNLTQGTLDLTASNYALTVARNWSNTGGEFLTRASTISFNGTAAGYTIQSRGYPFNNLQVNGTNGYWTLIDSMTVVSTMTFTAGTLDSSTANCSGASCDIKLNGSWINTGGLFVGNTNRVTFAGTVPGLIITPRGLPYNDISVTGAGGYYTLQGSMTILGNAALSAGTLDTKAGSNLGVLLRGNWANTGGTFRVNSSTFILNGLSAQTITELSTTTFNVIIDSNTSSGGVTFASSFTATSLRINGASLGAATTVYFTANSTYTVASLNLLGSSGKPVWIRSTVDGTPWYLNNTVSNAIDYVDVQDSNARAGIQIAANDGTSLNSGNNTNWNFGGGGSLRTWWGTSSSNWFLGANWDSGVPGAQDSVLVVSTATNMPVLTAAVTISSLTINSGSTMTLTGYPITLSSFTNSGAFVFRGTEPVTTPPYNLTGSTITYTNPTAAGIILSTWVYQNLQLNGTGGTFSVVGGSLTILDSLTLTAGTLDPTASNFQIGVGDSWINTGGGYVTRAATVSFTGSSPTSIIRTRGYPIFNLEFSGSGYWTQIDSMTVTSTVTIAAGTLDASAANCSGLSCNMTVAGSWYNRGGFYESQSSTVTFTGLTAQSIQSSGDPFNNLVLNGLNGTYVLIDSMTVLSTMTLTAGTLDTSSNNYPLAVGAGWLNNSATATVRGSTVSFVGSGGAWIRSRGYPFAGLEFTGTGYWTLIDSITATGALTLPLGTLDTSTSNLAVQIGGSWINSGGSFVARSSTVTLTSSGLTESIETNGSQFYNLALSGAGYFTLVDSITVNSNLTLTAGTIDTSASACGGTSCDVRVVGSWFNNGGAFYDNTSTVTFASSAAGQRIISRGYPFYNFAIAGGAAGYYTMVDSITVVSTVTITGGTLDTSTSNLAITLGGSWWNTGGSFVQQRSTITFTSSTGQSIATRGSPFRIVTLGNGTSGGYWTLIDSMTVSTMTISAGNGLNLNGFGLRISSFTNGGQLTLQSLEPVRAAPLNLTGSTVTYTATSGAPLVFSTWSYQNLQINGGSATTFNSTGPITVAQSLTLTQGTLDMTSSNNPITVNKNWINTGGGFTARSSTVTLNGTTTGNVIQSRGYPFANLQLNGSGGYWTMIDSITVASTMTLTAGTLDTSAANCSGSSCGVRLGGSWWNTGGEFADNTATLTLAATNGQSLQSRGYPFYHITLDGVGGYYTLQDSMTVSGNVTLTNGTLDTKQGTNSGLLLYGNWINNGGKFRVYQSTITFKGAAGQSFTELSTTTFNVLIDSNTTSSGVTFASSFTATVFTINSVGLNAPTTAYFQANSTFTIRTLNLNGASGKNVWLRPTPAGQYWYLNNVTTNTVSFTDVAYSSASAGLTIVAGPNSTDSGNNTNWTFVILSVSLSPSTYDFGPVSLGASTMSVSAVTTVTNSGNASETFSISVTTTGALTRWAVGTALPTGTDTFVLEGTFNSVQPSDSVFGLADIVTSTPTASSGAIYAGDQTGQTVAAGTSRPLWMKLYMPQISNTTDQQSMLVTISASNP